MPKVASTTWLDRFRPLINFKESELKYLKDANNTFNDRLHAIVDVKLALNSSLRSYKDKGNFMFFKICLKIWHT